MKKSNEGWAGYLKTNIGRRVLRFSLTLSAASLVAGIALLLQVPSSAAQRRPQPETLPSDQFGPNHFLLYNGQDDPNSACLYYMAIGAASGCDAAGRPSPNFNFTQWKMRNGLAVNPGFGDDLRTGEASALYFNAVDLALARSMHGNITEVDGGTVAYYVCNYTLDPRIDSYEDAIQNALFRARDDAGDPDHSGAAACVAFDYSANRPFTKFYVFKNGILVVGANLDGQGEKYVPGLCKTCHGADKVGRVQFTANDDPDIGAHFLPFDLDNFDYLDFDPFFFGHFFTRSNQERTFKRLNEMILETEPQPPAHNAITDLIDGWYAGGRVEQNSEFIPMEWRENKQLYRRVVKPSCRTCHVALQPDFASLAEFTAFRGAIHSHVCDNAPTPLTDARTMPNSKVTFDQFWLSHVQGAVLERFLRGAMGNASITCPPPKPP